jgi:hypothetical protein
VLPDLSLKTATAELFSTIDFLIKTFWVYPPLSPPGASPIFLY